MAVIRQHAYADGKCLHCGDLESDNTGKNRSCIAREMPRAVPQSIFAAPWKIGEELARIKKEEGRG